MPRLHRLGCLGAALAFMLVPVTPASPVAEPPTHGPITIASDKDFQACTCVTAGTGTASDPYVIGPWTITSPSSGGWALKVDNSSGAVRKFFRVAGLTAGYRDFDPTHPLIWLVKVTNPTAVANLTAIFDGIGVRLDSDANVTLDNITANRMQGDGVLSKSASAPPTRAAPSARSAPAARPAS